jgi:hypothetical protein
MSAINDKKFRMEEMAFNHLKQLVPVGTSKGFFYMPGDSLEDCTVQIRRRYGKLPTTKVIIIVDDCELNASEAFATMIR